MKVTQWFSMRDKPVHKGIYECRPPFESYVYLNYWDGQYFCDPANHLFVDGGTLQWRGIAKD